MNEATVTGAVVFRVQFLEICAFTLSVLMYVVICILFTTSVKG